MTLMTGGEALMDYFSNEGVEYVFGLPGRTEISFLDALEDRSNIKYILGLHETIAVAMAEGYSRTSRKIGVVNLHTLAGLSAAMPMIQSAQAGGVPLIITAGQQDTRLEMQEPRLDGDLVGLAGHFCKWSTEIVYTEDIPIAMHRAFKVATQPPTGPVFISLPINTLEQNLEYKYIPRAPVFGNIHPDIDAMNIAKEFIINAKKPAIIVGNGVTKNDALPEVVELAELTGARVYQTQLFDTDFPTSHPQFLGDLDTNSLSTRELLQSIDVLIVIGTPLFAQLDYLPKPLLTNMTKIIQVDDDPWQIAKNFPITSALSGNIKTSISDLNHILQKNNSTDTIYIVKERIADISLEKEKIKPVLHDIENGDQGSISVSQLTLGIKETIKPDTALVVETISYSKFLRRSLDFCLPFSYIHNCGGTMGWALPGALGVKLGIPDRPVVALVGDGTAIWSIQSLWTAAHYQIPVTYIICADRCYKTLKTTKNRMMGEKAKGRYLGLDFKKPSLNFCQMAQAMGVSSQKIDRPDELIGKLKIALESNEPSLVEVQLDDEY